LLIFLENLPVVKLSISQDLRAVLWRISEILTFQELEDDKLHLFRPGFVHLSLANGLFDCGENFNPSFHRMGDTSKVAL
jgi:hypothetical protein